MNAQRERAELEAVLASTLFARAPDLSRILKYVCEKHFSNQSDRIKEYSIAVEALGRGPDFRPEEDSIVRVQAARLRKHLKQYYETDGVDHPLQIRISPAGYRPEFAQVGTAEDLAAAAQNGDTHAQKGTAPRTKLPWGLALVASALVLAVLAAILYFAPTNPAKRPAAPPAPPAATPGVNIRVGFTDAPSLDVAGSTWIADRYFTGGEVYSQPESQIRRTYDQPLYQTGRRGNFSYAIPLKPGVYELHLHFAEIFYALTVGADTQRQFDVAINGVPTLSNFDPAKDAGGIFIADEKIFKDVSPGRDGLLRLDFSSGRRGFALLNGIEVLPGVSGKMMPARILCSAHSSLDRNGVLWKADQYYSGGRIAELGEAIRDPRLGNFSSYRTGNFDYAIPVADGSYRVRLLFAEPVYGRERPPQDGTGRRVFDVHCNGRTLVSGLDIFKEAGGGYRVIEKAFRHVKPDAQGKILLSFVPVRGYSALLAIEVLDENW